MNKKKYNFNGSAARRYDRDANEKTALLNKLTALARKKATVDMVDFVKNPYKAYQEAIVEQYGGENFKHIGFVKLCQLLNIEEREEISNLSAKYMQNRVELNPATFKAKKQDFWTYAEGKEQIERLEYAQVWVDRWAELKKEHPRANAFKFCQALDGLILPDYSDLNSVLVNTAYVTGNKRNQL